MRLWGNDYNKMEFAGAFGDLGTLIPFVVGYITLNKMDPLGTLVRALVIKDIKLQKQNLFVLLVTAGTAMWNMGVAYLAGLILYYGLQRRWFKV